MNPRNWIWLTILPGLLAGCAGPDSKDAAGLSEQDTVEALAIKAELLEEPDLAGSAIDVDTAEGRVILRGFVETNDQRERAEAITRESSGTSKVVNEIIVK